MRRSGGHQEEEKMCRIRSALYAIGIEPHATQSARPAQTGEPTPRAGLGIRVGQDNSLAIRLETAPPSPSNYNPPCANRSTLSHLQPENEDAHASRVGMTGRAEEAYEE